ncbi:bifunctional adenosylcobinamide kinase/adenosylcobinamide-phosphate guanylyltransferase [uncultured Clostridium sp.]|uniref:bifunctional adenosylcobinamide kinase/adenosylcobinamide-phosphate guanylyltransferase n=1 Tax=uncultured Clostridium sp. TaxID=59620 RepID=UPI0025EA48C2|nr:bifunctional adenosylcobinamide kinase/adenosylcobinamide-phosphate guanylyltransferase [uncultured Clostridium sp.]
MITLVTGGSGSGKSEFAENKACSYKSENLIYIATMMAYDEESLKKIERHKNMRKDKNFKTIECAVNLSSVNLPKKSTVLIDCMSNLVANEMYSKDGSKENAVSSIIKGIEALKSSSLNLVIVTNEVFSDGVEYSKETEEYIKNLGNINEYLGKIANEVVEVVYSIPIYHKKEGEHVN